MSLRHSNEAAGGGIHPAEVAVALKLVLSMEAITSRPMTLRLVNQF